jgi:DNA-binding IclR family transcriptional regulator
MTAKQPSSRLRTRESGIFVRDTPSVRSLERGLYLLRAFRPGVHSLTNSELAERTNFPRATTSRLAATLVSAGFLDYEIETGLYRLGSPFLGLGLAVRSGSSVLQAALPIMREVSEGQRINIGLGLADDTDIVYLESVRRNQLTIFRHIISGTRLPMAETALGRAWFAGLTEKSQHDLLLRLRERYQDTWDAIERDLHSSLSNIRHDGYCSIEHKSTVAAVAAPLIIPGQLIHAINISYRAPSDNSLLELRHKYGRLVLSVVERVRCAINTK